MGGGYSNQGILQSKLGSATPPKKGLNSSLKKKKDTKQNRRAKGLSSKRTHRRSKRSLQAVPQMQNEGGRCNPKKTIYKKGRESKPNFQRNQNLKKNRRKHKGFGAQKVILGKKGYPKARKKTALVNKKRRQNGKVVFKLIYQQESRQKRKSPCSKLLAIPHTEEWLLRTRPGRDPKRSYFAHGQ